jgi:hypothetical protein
VLGKPARRFRFCEDREDFDGFDRDVIEGDKLTGNPMIGSDVLYMIKRRARRRRYDRSRNRSKSTAAMR